MLFLVIVLFGLFGFAEGVVVNQNFFAGFYVARGVPMQITMRGIRIFGMIQMPTDRHCAEIRRTDEIILLHYAKTLKKLRHVFLGHSARAVLQFFFVSEHSKVSAFFDVMHSKNANPVV